MTRIKTFDSTGLATNGRLYAGDLNAIQDHYADQNNLTQTIGTGSLSLGESGLQLVRYGPGEARFSGALRTDGIVRGLGGLYAGAYTTAQRDAIPAGSRPYGLQILNSTNNSYEWNRGTDAAPSWAALAPAQVEVPIGSVMDWPWASGSVPTWAVLPYGQAISRATYPTLHSLASGSGYAYGNGDGSTTFNVPDYRGRIGIGKDDMGGTAAGRITVGISGIAGQSLGAVGGSEGIVLTTGHLAAHNHGVNDGTHAHNISDSGHGHNISDPGHYHWELSEDGSDGPNWSVARTVKGGAFQTANTTASSGTNIGILANGTGIGIYAAYSNISTQNAGGNAAHPNVQPIVIVNKLMRAL